MLIFPKYSRLVGFVGNAYGYCLAIEDQAWFQWPTIETTAIVNYGVPRTRLDKLIIPKLIEHGRLKPIYNYYVELCLSKLSTFAQFDVFGVPHPRIIPIEEIKEYTHVLLRIDGMSRQRGMWFSTYPHAEVEELQKEIKKDKLFAVEVLDLRAEFRAFVWKESVLNVYPHIRIPPDANEILRKHQDDIWKHAITAVRSVQLDFGAVDIGICTDDRIIVFEVNSRFGIEDDDHGAMVALFIRTLITDS